MPIGFRPVKKGAVDREIGIHICKEANVAFGQRRDARPKVGITLFAARAVDPVPEKPTTKARLANTRPVLAP